MSQIAHASGFGGLENSPLARIGYYNKILAYGKEKEFLQYITNQAIDRKLTACNQVVQFTKQPHVGDWRPYEKNQPLIPDEVAPEAFTMSICNSAYKALKFDQLDISRICDRWPAFEEAFLQSAYDNLAHIFRKWVLSAMVLETDIHNKGSHAGYYEDTDLGSPNAPRRINSQNIHKELARLQQVLIDSKRWVDNEMFVMLPSRLMEALVDSPYANSWQMGTAGETSMLITGLMPGKLMGFNVYVVNSLPQFMDATGEIAFAVIAGHKDAFAFAGDLVAGDLVRPSGYFGIQYQMLAVWGGKAIYPDALAYGYWTIA